VLGLRAVTMDAPRNMVRERPSTGAVTAELLKLPNVK
jgi:hypothetical protein